MKDKEIDCRRYHETPREQHRLEGFEVQKSVDSHFSSSPEDSLNKALVRLGKSHGALPSPNTDRMDNVSSGQCYPHYCIQRTLTSHFLRFDHYRIIPNRRAARLEKLRVKRDVFSRFFLLRRSSFCFYHRATKIRRLSLSVSSHFAFKFRSHTFHLFHAFLSSPTHFILIH